MNASGTGGVRSIALGCIGLVAVVTAGIGAPAAARTTGQATVHPA